MKPSQPRRNQWGNLFLLAATLGFAFFLVQPWWSPGDVRYLRAFFEASLVGALADWFAVTALFKRPLGLPLPHTDVIYRRKDQLVEALPRFLASFLEPEKLNPVLKSVDWAGLLIRNVDPDTLDRLLEEGLAPLLAAGPERPWEADAIGLGAELLHRELVLRRESLVGPMTEFIKKNAGWKGLFVGRDTVDDAVEGFLEELRAVRDQTQHPLRKSLSSALREALPRIAQQLRPSRWTASTWKRLESDSVFRATVNEKVGQISTEVWEKSGTTAALTSALGYLLEQTDARSLSSRVESAVRNDLQYIRVNGALVGGLAGLGLELLRTVSL